MLLELRDPNDPTTRPMEREYLLVRDISHPLTSLPSPGLDKEDRQDTGHHHSDGQDFKNGRARANEEEEEEEKLREERLRRSLGPLTTGLASLGEELRRLEDQAQVSQPLVVYLDEERSVYGGGSQNVCVYVIGFGG